MDPRHVSGSMPGTTDDEDRLRLVFEATPNAMVMVDSDGHIVLVNAQTEILFGYDRAELLSMRVEELIPDRFRTEHEGFRRGFFSKPDRREIGAGRELFGRRKDGTEVPIEIGLNSIEIMDENLVLASIIDITERLAMQTTQTALREDLLRRSILDSLPFSILATDGDGTIMTANPAAEKLLGYHQDELVGSSIRLIYDDNEIAERHRTAAADSGPEAGLDEQEWIYQRKDGTLIPVNEANTAMYAENGEVIGFLIVAHDITERKDAEAFFRHMAHHDSLTNLPNRTLLCDQLVEPLRQADLTNTKIVVLVLNLDHFKRVNDSLGHHVGDELLLRMSARLQQRVGENDLVARLGGNEFAIVFADVEDAEVLVNRIDGLVRAVSAPIDVNGHELVVTASMGGATYPVNGADPVTLLKNADTAMYHAKTSGRNNFQWFTNSMRDEANDRIALSSALRKALALGELSVAYQPQVSLATGEVVGMEALARWNSPELGLITPDRFIPVAEDNGMIIELGQWVLQKACRDAVAIQAALGRSIRLAVNVSPTQFRHKDLLAVITEAISDSGFNPANLELEITEGILMGDPRDVIEALHATRELGIAIVVDDFGTGFSSLAYLTRFPIDKIKIDRSFVRDLTADDANAAIVDTIIGMAHTLGMKVVAEGIETEAQHAYLHERGCDEAQGFLYSEAILADHFASTVDEITPT